MEFQNLNLQTKIEFLFTGVILWIEKLPGELISIYLMFNVIKSAIHKLFNNFGYKIVGIKNLVKHNSFDALHKFILKEFFNGEKKVIFDVGANKGDSVKRFKKIFPNCKIYSFEPDANF